MDAQEDLKTIKMYMDALIGLHTRHQRGGLTKANLTTEVINITQKISEKAENVEKHVKKSAEEIQKKENKIRELQKYNSTLSTKLTQMKNERNSLQQTLNEVFGESTFPDADSQASSKDSQASSIDSQTLQSTSGIVSPQLSTPTHKRTSTVSLSLTPKSLFSPASTSKTPEHTEPGPSKTPPDSQEDVFGDQEIKKQKKN